MFHWLINLPAVLRRLRADESHQAIKGSTKQAKNEQNKPDGEQPEYPSRPKGTVEQKINKKTNNITNKIENGFHWFLALRQRGDDRPGHRAANVTANHAKCTKTNSRRFASIRGQKESPPETNAPDSPESCGAAERCGSPTAEESDRTKRSISVSLNRVTARNTRKEIRVFRRGPRSKNLSSKLNVLSPPNARRGPREAVAGDARIEPSSNGSKQNAKEAKNCG